MASGSCSCLSPLFRRSLLFGFEEMNDSDSYCKSFPKKKRDAGSMPMIELRRKILIFRDILDLPPCNGSASIDELVLGLMDDLKNLYPEIIPFEQLSEMSEASVEQGLAYFCEALKSIGDSWMTNDDTMERLKYDLISFKENNVNSEKLAETLVALIDCMIKMAREKFDMMDEDEHKKEYYYNSRGNSFEKILTGTDCYSENNSCSSCCSSPLTPTSVLPELTRDFTKAKESTSVSYSPPLLMSLRVQALGKLNPIDLKHLSAACGSTTLDKKELIEPETEAKRSIETTNGTISKESSDSSSTEKDIREIPKQSLNELRLDTTQVFLVPRQLQNSPLKVLPETKEPTTTLLAQSTPPPRPPSPTPPRLSLPKPSLNGAAAPLPPLKNLGKIVNRASPPPAPPPTPPTPLPPLMPSKGSAPSPSPPPPMPHRKGGGPPPPPPPLGAARSLRPKKANTKLKRSSQIGNLYRALKGKLEGTNNPDGKSSNGKRSTMGSTIAGGKQGMADALAEMTKRSAYFQQIEEDVQKYAKPIMEMKTAIGSFQTKDMSELLKFHKDVEKVLEHLTDETQVLSRFEGFPTKKLETLRTAAALYRKLHNIITELQNWKIEAPLGQLLDKVDRYFSKIKGEVDALERTKDEESKKFQSQNIHFDFNILVRIKESMVDVSSSCMELALKERREAKAATEVEKNKIREGAKIYKGGGKMLWRAFQFAFRVYTFAGGHDDRADNLTRELALEIESDPHHH